ncbi:MAG: dehydrogenase [Cryobacterium sp.]|nr:dehydrogenase [Cryobacterium sp.]
MSRDFIDDNGREVWGDIGLGGLDSAGIAWEYLDQDVDLLRPSDIEGRPAILFGAPGVTAATFENVSHPPLVLARFGVGFDAVELEACTRAGTAVTITPDGARRPVATAALGLLLGALMNFAAKDRIVRENRWADRYDWMGRGLTGSTVGLIGLGNTGAEFARLLAPFDVSILAHDPYCLPEAAAEVGAVLVTKDELATRSDSVVVMAALTPETHHLIDTDFLRKMKASASLVNVSRGGLVDELALVDALKSGSIRAAALDVFEEEPLGPHSRLPEFDNVLLTPHSVSWTNEMSLGNGRSAVQAIVDALCGRAPKFVVNKAVLEGQRWRNHLAVRE